MVDDVVFLCWQPPYAPYENFKVGDRFRVRRVFYRVMMKLNFIFYEFEGVSGQFNAGDFRRVEK